MKSRGFQKNIYLCFTDYAKAFDSVGKVSACNAGDQSLIHGLGRTPGEGNGNPLQYSCQKNPVDEGAWWATVGCDLANKPPQCRSQQAVENY